MTETLSAKPLGFAEARPPFLSVVVPYRDEAASLPQLYRELAQVLDGLDVSAEMLFVDDASRDEGPERMRVLARADPRVRLLSITPHSGQSAALEAGFRGARGEFVATLDADLQNDPADLPALIEAMGVADCACGVRMGRRDRPSKKLASWIANRVRRRALGDGVQDVGCSLRVMRRSYLARVKMFHGAHRFLPALLRIEGARIVERPVRHRARRHGESKYGILGRLSVVWIDLLAVMWLTRRIDAYEAKELSPRA